MSIGFECQGLFRPRSCFAMLMERSSLRITMMPTNTMILAFWNLSHICTPSIQQETGIAQWHLPLTFGYPCTPGELDCAMCRTAPKHRIWCLVSSSCYQLFNYVWKPIKAVNIEFPSRLFVKPSWKFYVVSYRLSSILKIHPQQSSATRNRDS